jgi:hypothetical protein
MTVIHQTLFLLSILGEAKLLRGSVIAPRSRYGAIPLSDELNHAMECDWIQPDRVAYAGRQSV